MPMQVRFTNAPRLQVRVVALPGNVLSVFGRQGAVVATNGDYTASQVTNVPSGLITAINVQDALNQLGSGTFISGAALTAVNDTNITATLGGTPTTALLRATSITVGWTGTLAAARLNSNVVQAVTNDTNVTGSISTQTITLGWTSTLAVSRGGTGTGTWATNTIIIGGTTSTGTFQQAASGASGTVLTSQGAGVAPVFLTPAAGSGGTPSGPQGRLTLTTGVAITTADVTGATTLYYTPAVGSYVPITTDGTTFTMTAFTEMSQATTDTTKSPGSATVSSNYDIFVWSDAGTLRATRGPPWSSATVRGTGAGTTEIDFTTKFPTNKNAITNGPAANRGVLVGSVRSNASSQLVDTVLFRWVSNIYNAVPRSMAAIDTTDTWVYSTLNVLRQANNNTANQLDFLQSLPGGMLQATASHLASTSLAPGIIGTGIGIGQTTANDANNWTIGPLETTGYLRGANANYAGYPGMGRNFAAWLEFNQSGTGTVTWVGDNGVPLLYRTGINGWINN